MSNLFKIKRGATVPTSDVLSAYELGFMTEGGKLYIGLGDRVKMLTAGPSSTSPKAAGNASVGTEDTFARGDHIHPLQTSVSGNAGTATKLQTARTIQIDLASTSSTSFDGSDNITPGVKGILPIANGGTGATTASEAVQNLFDVGAAVTSYPTKPGIYRCIGTNVCTNSQSTLTGYGVLVIFKAVYGMHFYLDHNGTLIYGYSGETFQQPSTWNMVTYT